MTGRKKFFSSAFDNWKRIVNYTNVHLVAVFHPEAGYCSIYTNGMLAAINSSISITMANAMASGDPYNYIGHSLWAPIPSWPFTWMSSASTKAR